MSEDSLIITMDDNEPMFIFVKDLIFNLIINIYYNIMFEKIVEKILNPILSEYLEDFNSENMKIGLWSG